MRVVNPADTYRVLKDAMEEVRDRWKFAVCPTCFGRINPETAHPSWPACECRRDDA